VSTTDVTQTGTGPAAPQPDLEASEPASEPESPRPRSRWTARRIGALLAPALVYLGVREVGLLVLAWMAARNDQAMGSVLRSWDGLWFLEIARAGYGGVSEVLVDANNNRSAETPLAFFPGYPAAVRWVASIDGGGGIGLVTAAFVVTIGSGVICAYGLARLGRQVSGGSNRVGLALVALFAASPMAIVLSMAYSEALFCAFAAWSLVGVLERRWVLAGTCCALAGLVRPTAAALVIAVGLAALVAVMRRTDGWRPWVGGALAPIGLLGYLSWVGAQTGEVDGWFALQERGWDSGFDGGAATVTFSLDVLAEGRSVLEVATVALIVLAVILLVIGISMRLDWRLLGYGAGVLVMDLASNGLMNSKARLMLPAFTLLIPVAIALAKRRPATMMVTLAALAVASAWFGAYAITSWGYAI
jgi:hypothetical protein